MTEIAWPEKPTILVIFRNFLQSDPTQIKSTSLCVKYMMNT